MTRPPMPAPHRDPAPITVRRLAGSVLPMRRTLHARSGAARPGEADRAELLALDAGAELTWPAAALDASTIGGRVVEWLVLAGEVCVDGERLGLHDFLRHPLSSDGHRVESLVAARVHVRFGMPAGAGALSRTLARASDARWEGEPGGARRRVLWADDVESAVLVRAPAGYVAAAHRHRVDEDCLLLAGEVDTGELSLQAGDFQVAPAGSRHGVVRAVTEVLAYLRGDATPSPIEET